MLLFDNLMSWSVEHGMKTPLQIRENIVQINNNNNNKDGTTAVAANYRYVVLDPTHMEAKKRNTMNIIDAPLSICMISPTSDGLADRLLFEKEVIGQEDSFFAPYLATLPTLESFQATMPRFWNEERWNILSSTSSMSTSTSTVFADGGQLKAAVELDQETRLNLLSSTDDWAQAVVDSRAHFMPPAAAGAATNNNNQEYSLTPVLDMINHNPTVSTRMQRTLSSSSSFFSGNADDIDPDQQHQQQQEDRIQLQIPTINNNNNDFFLAPLKNLFMGGQQEEQEVFTSYGNMPNVELLLNYGFVQTDNPCNSEIVNIPFIGRQSSPLSIVANANGSVENLGPLRKALMNRQELDLLDDNNNNGNGDNGIISQRNEMEVMALIGGTLEEMVYDLKAPIQNALNVFDHLIASYLQERQKTLQSCLRKIQAQ
eukprot:CAMPEP_0198141518 /NCGR_PEP_ID=MMETSP1443-20131203/4516_1 /TAXON_ID=186043 /ORGANISM="Entomoneis sp., Strain CCMP2396" /LENGTH=427 /DNA_ID=CAMNT_0043804295 /DNA_START=257 /DNA_END=1537 /DNA_ORIENTATION=+